MSNPSDDDTGFTVEEVARAVGYKTPTPSKPPLPITREVVNDCISAGVNATYWTNTHVLALLDRIDELEQGCKSYGTVLATVTAEKNQLDRALAEARIDLAAAMKSRDAAHTEATKAFKANDDLKKELAYYKKTAEDQAKVLRQGTPTEEAEIEALAEKLFLVEWAKQAMPDAAQWRSGAECWNYCQDTATDAITNGRNARRAEKAKKE
jgi:hypothetical protein